MSPLRYLIERTLKSKGLNRSQLIAALGYKNPSKGLRRLETFLDTTQAPNEVFDGIPLALNLPLHSYLTAIEATRNAIAKRKQQAFRPFIWIELAEIPRPLFAFAACQHLVKLDVPEVLQDRPFDEEIKKITRIYQNHHKAHNGRYGGTGTVFTGFRYHRTYEQTFRFDTACHLLDMQISETSVPEVSLQVSGKPFSLAIL